MSAEKRKRAKDGLSDILVGMSALGVAGSIVLLLPSQVGGATLAAVGNMRSPAFFPVVAAVLMGLLGLLLTLRGATASRRAPSATAGEPAGDSRRMGMVALLLIGATLALPLAGFVPTVAVLMAGLGFAFGYRRAVILGALCLLMPLAIFVLFESALRVLLPRGPF